MMLEIFAHGLHKPFAYVDQHFSVKPTGSQVYSESVENHLRGGIAVPLLMVMDSRFNRGIFFARHDGIFTSMQDEVGASQSIEFFSSHTRAQQDCATRRYNSIKVIEPGG